MDNIPNDQQSLHMTFNLLQACIFTALYLRGLFQEEDFEDAILCGMPIKILQADSSLGSTLVCDWLQSIFEPLQKEYLMQVQLVLRDPVTKMRYEVYDLTFDYPSELTKFAIQQALEQAHKAKDTLQIGSSKEDIKQKSTAILQSLVEVIRTMPPLPTRVALTLHLAYTDNTPVDFSHPHFAATQVSQFTFKSSRALGQLKTNHHYFAAQIMTNGLPSLRDIAASPCLPPRVARFQQGFIENVHNDDSEDSLQESDQESSDPERSELVSPSLFEEGNTARKGQSLRKSASSTGIQTPDLDLVLSCNSPDRTNTDSDLLADDSPSPSRKLLTLDLKSTQPSALLREERPKIDTLQSQSGKLQFQLSLQGTTFEPLNAQPVAKSVTTSPPPKSYTRALRNLYMIRAPQQQPLGAGSVALSKRKIEEELPPNEDATPCHPPVDYINKVQGNVKEQSTRRSIDRQKKGAVSEVEHIPKSRTGKLRSTTQLQSSATEEKGENCPGKAKTKGPRSKPAPNSAQSGKPPTKNALVQELAENQSPTAVSATRPASKPQNDSSLHPVTEEKGSRLLRPPSTYSPRRTRSRTSEHKSACESPVSRQGGQLPSEEVQLSSSTATHSQKDPTMSQSSKKGTVAQTTPNEIQSTKSHKSSKRIATAAKKLSLAPSNFKIDDEPSYTSDTEKGVERKRKTVQKSGRPGKASRQNKQGGKEEKAQKHTRLIDDDSDEDFLFRHMLQLRKEKPVVKYHKRSTRPRG